MHPAPQHEQLAAVLDTKTSRIESLVRDLQEQLTAKDLVAAEDLARRRAAKLSNTQAKATASVEARTLSSAFKPWLTEARKYQQRQHQEALEYTEETLAAQQGRHFTELYDMNQRLDTLHEENSLLSKMVK